MKIIEIYDIISIVGKKSGKCLCGIKRNRSKTFTQTLNPYNRNPDGSVCSESDILKNLKIEKDAWLKARIYCKDCEMPSVYSMTQEQHDFYNNFGEDATVDKYFRKKK